MFFLLVLFGALWLIGSGNHIVGALFSALSVFGVTTAGLTAKVKSSAQEVLDKLKASLDEDVIITAATELPSDVTLPAPSLRAA